MVKAALSGQVDVVYYDDTTALVIDFKSGFSEPDPAEINSQLKVLAVLVALHLPHVTEVYAQIISGPYGVTEARYTIQELAHAYNEILDTLRAIHAENAPLMPDIEQCKHCSAKLICPAIQKQVVEPMLKARTEPLPKDPELALEILNRGEVLARYLKEVKEFYTDLMTQDPSYSIPGWVMAPGATIREVTDWDAARARLGEYLDVKELKSAADYRLGELEKSLGKTLKLKGQPLRERMNQILQGLYVEKQNAPSLRRMRNEAKVAELKV